MINKDKLKNFMTPFQWFEVLGVIGFTLYFGIIDNEHPSWYIIIDAFASICGIFCVVLCAGGKKSQYYWGTVNSATYVVISYINKLYGEVMLNGLYYLPCQFIGLYVWKKHQNEQEGTVKSKKMKLPFLILTIAACLLGIWLYKILLAKLGGNSTWLDSTTTIVSIVANLLMILRYREQWILWIVVNTFSVVMWFIRGDFIMVAMWAFYLMNAFYGFITWTKSNKNLNKVNE